MKKKIKVKIKNEQKEMEDIYQAIFSNEQIQYIEKENTKVKVNMKNLTLIRENHDMKMEYFFKENKGTIFLKAYNKVLPLVIQVKNIIHNKDKLIIEYEIENSNFSYSIDWRAI